MKCLCVFREITSFPKREKDNAFILKGVSDVDLKVHLIEPEIIEDMLSEKWDVVVSMCGNPENLEKLRKINTVFINNIDSVYNCYRQKCLNLL